MQASILDCFKDLISIRGGCDDVVPSSGLYLDDIGLSLANLDEFVTKDYKDGGDLFQQKKDFALKLLTSQINQHLSDRFLERTLLESQRLGYYQDDLYLISGVAGNRKGINIKFWNFDSYIDLFVSEISVQVHYDGPINIKVYDLLSAKLLDTIAITAVSDKVVSVFPQKTYGANRKKLNLLFVIDKVVDGGGNEVVLSANTTYIYPGITGNGGCASCSVTGGNFFKNAWLWSKPVTIDDTAPKLKHNLQPVADTGGISIVYSLNCNHREWLCTIAQSIALPLLYKTGSELMGFCDDVSSNERVNTFTFANGDKISQRQSKYEIKYAQAMDNILNNINLPQDANCFVCNSRTANRIILP